jgi:hypothetical protein
MFESLTLSPATSTDSSDSLAEIDQLVYQLYGLTADDIKIVEESGGK